VPVSHQFCTFVVDGNLFGTSVGKVQEVIQHQPMTRVPLAPHAVRGMMNLRGQIVLALDLRRRLGLPDFAAGQVPMNVVVQTHEGSVSLLVDDIGDVLEVDEQTFEKPPETLRGFARKVVRGVYKLPGRLLLELDIDAVVDLRDCTNEHSQGFGSRDFYDSASA